jgi:hypothetical protein
MGAKDAGAHIVGANYHTSYIYDLGIGVEALEHYASR